MSFRTRSVLLILIMILSSVLILHAQSPKEIYDFEYILALYDQQSDDTALIEISNFQTKYPSSLYANEVGFMKAEILYFGSRFSDAIQAYEALLRSDPDVTMLQDIFLHKASAHYYIKDYDEARKLLEKLRKLTGDAEYQAQAILLQAKVAYDSGQYYSAEKYYKESIQNFPDDTSLRFEYFRTLLKLKKEDEAVTIRDSLELSEPFRSNYDDALMAYYLNNGLYSRFIEISSALITNPDLTDVTRRQMLMQYYYATGKHAQFSALLDKSPSSLSQFDYYRALDLEIKGDYVKADSILAGLTRSKEPQTAVLSYLERLKILSNTDPNSAITQLEAFMQTPQSVVHHGEQLQLLGFLYQKTGNYEAGIKNLIAASMYEISGENLDRIYSLIPDVLLRSGRSDEAVEYYNRYLNLFPEGLYRDEVMLELGLLAYKKGDYPVARSYLSDLVTTYPNTDLYSKASYYLGEVAFSIAEYSHAIPNYEQAGKDSVYASSSTLRIAQSLYFDKKYAAADSVLTGLNSQKLMPDILLLKGSISFNLRRYDNALSFYEQAIALADSGRSRNELLSYKALTLYQMKRFDEASSLFYSLSSLKESPDTYLYLSARSAYLGGNYAKALELYYTFVDQYSESDFILEVYSEIATINYNQTRYEDSLYDWINVLKRFRAQLGFEPKEFELLQRVFAGMELNLLQIDSEDVITMIAELVDSFTSDYIKFELQYLIVKLYASRDLWADLLTEAEKIRSVYTTRPTSDIEMLMAESLIRLNRYSEADSLLNSLYAETTDPTVLLKRADFDLLMGRYSDALDKYRTLYDSDPDRAIWVKMLSCASKLEYQGYSELWKRDPEAYRQVPEVALSYIGYLQFIGDYERMFSMADSVLILDFSPGIHGRAYLAQARADLMRNRYSDAISTLNRIKLVFKDYPDILRDANFWLIKAMHANGLTAEAEILFDDVRAQLTTDMIAEIDELLGD